MRGTNRVWRRRGLAGLVCAIVIAVTDTSAVQGTHPVTGRRIAPVMSHRGADWLDRAEREEEEAPERALEAMGVRPGQTVVDLGAGSGYFTVRLAPRVGPTGRVIAVDIQPEMIARLRERLQREGIANVTPVLGSASDPKLPDGSADLVLMVDVYHELASPQQMLRHIARALRPGGRLVLLEYRKEDPGIPIRPEHKMSVAEAKAELEAEGYRLVKVSDVLPRQHILIFGL
jgi:ubiquinone/menaquinone biosynthesis C-methylase UbiE